MENKFIAIVVHWQLKAKDLMKTVKEMYQDKKYAKVKVYAFKLVIALTPG